MNNVDELMILATAWARAAMYNAPGERLREHIYALSAALTDTLYKKDARSAELEDTLNRQDADLSAMLYRKDDNDRLTAAAPELLEALEDAMQWFSKLKDWSGVGDPDIDLYRAAITKAKGETP